jgi:predicted permease
MLPLSMNNVGQDATVPGYTPPGGREGGSFGLSINMVDPGYLGTLRIPVIVGRGIRPDDDARAPKIAVVNETFARELFRDGQAVGRTIAISGEPVTIVGVTRDAKYTRLDERPAPFAFLPLAQHWQSSVNVLVRTSGDPANLAGAITRELRALDPNLPRPTTTTLRQATSVVLLPQRVAAAVTGVLGLAGLLLAAVGLYGVLSFSTAQRTREIGVRVALGAQRRDVLALVVRDGMGLVGMGMGAGLVLALLATRALVPFLFGVSPVDPLAFIGMGTLLGGTALLAAYLPARRAAGMDPVRSLRED